MILCHPRTLLISHSIFFQLHHYCLCVLPSRSWALRWVPEKPWQRERGWHVPKCLHWGLTRDSGRRPRYRMSQDGHVLQILRPAFKFSCSVFFSVFFSSLGSLHLSFSLSVLSPCLSYQLLPYLFYIAASNLLAQKTKS